MKIAELIETGSGVNITVTPLELKEFALTIIDEAKAMKATERENYLTAKETAEKLGVTTNTLWRWQKINYLVPIKVGSKSLYKESDITKLMEGQRA